VDNRFLTETAAMRTLTFSSPRGDHTFKIGLGLVGLFAALELTLLSYHFVGRSRAGRSVAAPASVTQPAAEARPTAAATAPAVAMIPAPTVAPAPTEAAAAPAASVAPPATAPAEDPLVKEAVEWNSRGDTAIALNRLQKAVENNPKNAQAYAEMAKIYDSTSNFDRANEMWRKVHDLGPTAGAAYELADARLKRGAVATPAPQTAEAAPPQPAAAAPSSDAIPDGSTFGISEITTSETPDPDSDTNLLLKIGVRKRPGAVIDHTKVKIQVFFYDTVDDRDIKLTDAEVNYEWLTPDHDWASAKPEVLAVTYVRPKNKARSQDSALSEAAAAVNPNKKGRVAKPAPPSGDDSSRRKYLGYIVRIYYNDKLQAVRADPTKLLNLFPPPSTTSPP
jgi:tetratricopeptide (TPR) repeat protein